MQPHLLGIFDCYSGPPPSSVFVNDRRTTWRPPIEQHSCLQADQRFALFVSVEQHLSSVVILARCGVLEDRRS